MLLLQSRHPDAAIDDPRPSGGSFNMVDVRRLSAHVIKLRDIPEGVLVLSRLSHVWKSRVCDLVLRGADGNVMGIHDFLCLPEWTGAEPTLEDLAVGTPSSKIVTKAEASRKRKASTSGATSSHVAKRDDDESDGDDDESDDDDDDDACVEIPLVTPLRSAVVIPSSGTRVGVLLLPLLKVLTPKGVMVDDVAAPSAGASRPRSSSGPAPSFRSVFDDAIHTDFFPFSAGPYYATYPLD
ncbi:hypothetical protein Tco_0266665, partial [Tanacetum coccineum]